MGTKENPGPIDCYGNAAPDEPIFVLRSSDPDAPSLVREWAQRYYNRKIDEAEFTERDGHPTKEQTEKYNEAMEVANEMERYWNSYGGKQLMLCTLGSLSEPVELPWSALDDWIKDHRNIRITTTDPDGHREERVFSHFIFHEIKQVDGEDWFYVSPVRSAEWGGGKAYLAMGSPIFSLRYRGVE